MKPSMRAKLDHLDTRLAELNSLLTTEESTKDMGIYRKLTREHADIATVVEQFGLYKHCLLYTSPSPRDGLLSRMPSSA